MGVSATRVLVKGANAPLPAADSVRVVVSSSVALDVAALLVAPVGTVRSDADFVFYNHRDGAGVRLLPPAMLEISFPALAADIDKVIVVGSLDGSGPATFAEVNELTVTVRDGRNDGEIARFDPTGLSTESALILVEVYRRSGAWKVRAVGQGYESGLAGVVTEFGLTVDDTSCVPPAPATSIEQPPQALAAPTGSPGQDGGTKRGQAPALPSAVQVPAQIERPAVPVVNLDEALAAGTATRRAWAAPAGPVSSRVGSALVLVECPRFADNDPDNGMTAVIAERGHSGRLVAVGADGRRVTTDRFVDRDIAFAADGTVAAARRLTAEAVGLPAGGDYIQAHDPDAYLRPGSRWERADWMPRYQAYVGVAGDRPRHSRAMFETLAAAVTPDGSRAAFLEFQLPDDPDCALWEYDVAGRQWRWVTATPRGRHWQVASLSYSPCGQWLLVGAGSGETCLVRASDGVIVPLDADVFGVDALDHGWWPDRPGHLVAISRAGEHESNVLDLDLGAGTANGVCVLRGTHTNVGLIAHRPRISADGRWLALLAMLGRDPVAHAGRGSGNRAFVVDLASFTSEVVLDPAYASCGIERTVEALTWVDQTPRAGSFEPGPTLMARSIPAFGNPVLNEWKAERILQRHTRAAQFHFEAVDLHGVDPMLVTEEIRRFSAGAVDVEPSFRESLDDPQKWCFGRYVEEGAPHDDRNGWLALSRDLGRLVDGEPMEVDVTGELRNDWRDRAANQNTPTPEADASKRRGRFGRRRT
ncbi:hypothetical protein FRAHR75_210026 [Frankia sp. Hr75.2]|nr:hypothetical protein FRAHR75_210026 [Frankia sp. Hr75.2]